MSYTVKIKVSSIWAVSFPWFLRLNLEFWVFKPYSCCDIYGWIWSFWYQNRTSTVILTVGFWISGCRTVSRRNSYGWNSSFRYLNRILFLILTVRNCFSGYRTVRQFICYQKSKNCLHIYEMISDLFEKSRKSKLPG